MTIHEDDQSPLPDTAYPALREPLESRLTAYALDQLDGDERTAIEILLADPRREEARRTVAETRTLAAALKAARLADGAARSADLRRAVVAALAHDPAAATPTATERDRRRFASWNRWLALAGSLAAAVLVMAMVTSVRIDLGPAARQVARRQAPPPPVAMPAAADELLRRDMGVTEQRAEQKQAPATAAAPTPRLQTSAANPPRARKEAAKGAPLGEVTPDSASEAPAAATKTDAQLFSDNGMAAKRRSAGNASAARQPAFRPELRAFREQEVEQSRDRERYDHVAEHRFRSPADAPLSTFSIDVDTASYANVRRFLSAGRLPPADAVRIEEFVNYFRYDYPQPAGDDPFAVAVEVADCPWRAGHRLVRVGLQGRTVDRGARPAGNLVFLVDVSGSMGAPDKLPLVKQALAMLVEELTENDSVAIVTYAGNAGVRLPSTSGDQKGRILEAIESLAPGGSTHGSAGITLAYEQAAAGFIEGGANRVILATDGDLNVGITSDADLVELITRQAKGGTFLTVLGFGTGNLQDAKMEKLSANGNGIYAYIDSAREARKVLVEQLTGSTITIAKDVKIQVEFNPAQVASYRLLGYENRALAAQDFRDDRKDAGEIGAGHSVTALYEIALVDEAGGTAAAGAEPLKYQPQPEPARPAPRVDPQASRELLTVKLRFKQPEGTESVLREVPVAERGGAFAAASADLRFAAAVAAFGMILRDSPEKGEATLPLVASIAGAALGPDAGGYRAEFLDLVRKAQALRHE